MQMCSLQFMSFIEDMWSSQETPAPQNAEVIREKKALVSGWKGEISEKSCDALNYAVENKASGP